MPHGQPATNLAPDDDYEQLPLPMPLTELQTASGKKRFARAADPEGESPPVYLPAWPREHRGVPNAMLRGALFPAIQGKHRQYLRDALIRTPQGIEIYFTGDQLDQADLNVWQLSVEFARNSPLGNECEFSANHFLKTLNRQTGKHDHEWLRRSLGRLTHGLVSIVHGDHEYFGTLISGGIRNRRTGKYRLRLNPDLIQLYHSGRWSSVNWRQRHLLRRKPLALWLHGYYASHTHPYPTKISTLRDMSGSRTRHLGSFRQSLEQALDELKKIGAVHAWHMTGNLVHVQRFAVPPKSPRLPIKPS